MSQPEYARYAQAFADLAGPFAWLDVEALDANAAALARRTLGKPIRVATKSIRSVDVLRRVLQRPHYAGLMCFAAREAAMLAAQGFDDLLIAYPTLDESGIRQAAQRVYAGTRITFMVDDEGQLGVLERVAAYAGVRLEVCLELDVSQDYPGVRGLPNLHFGTYRSPLNTVAALLRLAGRVGRSQYLSLRGVMAYEGQVAGVGDAGSGVRAQVIRGLKRRALPFVASRRAEMVAALRRSGHDITLVNAGGTGSLESSAAEDIVTEVAAGSGLFAPGLFDQYQGFRHRPAAGFALRVVRQPASGVVTCLGGGYVASGAAGPDRLPTPYLPAGLHLLPTEGAGEVQTPLRVGAGVQLALGDLVFFRHAKAGELCEHFNELHAIAGTGLVGSYRTYRGQGLVFGG